MPEVANDGLPGTGAATTGPGASGERGSTTSRDRASFDGTAIEYLDARPMIEVEDIAAALEFFTVIARMDVETTLGEPVMFALLGSGPARFAVVENEDPAIPSGAAMYLTLLGLDTFVDRAERAGVRFVSPITDRQWGVRDVVVDCPGGGPQIAFGEPTTGRAGRPLPEGTW